VVYLHVPPEVLWERLRHDRHRPLLQVPQPRQRIFELYAQRDPLYREVADVVVDGGRLKPAAMLARVEEAVRDYRSGKGEGAVVAEGERDGVSWPSIWVSGPILFSSVPACLRPMIAAAAPGAAARGARHE